MIRGFVKEYEQPVYFDFNKIMSSEILKKTVAAAENYALKTYACVCDICGKKIILYNQHVVSKDNFAIPHLNCSQSKMFPLLTFRMS